MALHKIGNPESRIPIPDSRFFGRRDTHDSQIGQLFNSRSLAIKKENDLLTLAAAAPHAHPIALAIRQEAKRGQLTLPPIGEASVEVGYGIKVQVEEQWIRVGSRRFMQLEEILIPDEYQQTCYPTPIKQWVCF